MRVNVNGVNYSGDAVVFSVEDPAVPKNQTGGDRAGPYTRSGIQCCISLPKVWRPGLTLLIDAIIYPVDETDFKRELPRVMKKFTVEVPKYAADQPTELWVIRSANGEMNLVASNVGPTHADWPGAIKGWPEPSLAFKRKHWEIRVQSARSGIDSLSAAFENGKLKQQSVIDAWEVRKMNRPNSVKEFSGVDDPKFEEALTKSYTTSLRDYKERLEKLLEEKP
jgi:hypothetical protein